LAFFFTLRLAFFLVAFFRAFLRTTFRFFATFFFAFLRETFFLDAVFLAIVVSVSGITGPSIYKKKLNASKTQAHARRCFEEIYAA
jgi:hypothetical protein